MAASTSSGFHTYSSWGRTRSPKNILSPFRAGISALGAPKVITHGGLSADCVTENQRFLHITVDSNTSAGELTIFGLYNAAATYNADGSVNTFREFAITKDIHGAAFTLNVQGASVIVPIAGADQIRFKVTSGAEDTVSFYAACSTF
jgi:hypothetical protein